VFHVKHQDSRTQQLATADRQHVWHPFTQMQEWSVSDSLIIERGLGNYLYDTEGRRFLDAISSLWVTVHGHNHPILNAAIREQLDRVAHTTLLGLGNVPSIELAARLAEVAPDGLDRVFYSDSGSTAVEIALKMAFQFWQLGNRPEKRRFLHLTDAYHGDTLGAVAVGGIPLFHEIFGPIIIETIAAPTPNTYRHPRSSDPTVVRDEALATLRTILEQHGREIAGFILEPLVQGAAGMLTQPRGYLAEVARLCREHDVLLILDEVATGFGRTGTLFACEQEQVSPDILCLAKGITGGYLPLAATLTTEAVYERFLGTRMDRRTFFHGHTYTGNPLACAAAIASLDLFAREPVLEGARRAASRLADRLNETIAPLRWTGDIRQRGLMIGIELVAARSTGEPFAADRAIGARVCRAARDHGVLLRPLGDVIVLMPPLSITAAECDLLVEACARSIDDVLG
jgi:adenosylmethionine-8-amino-7-oxononanoate aminotransferase